jgi:hypothetical protein
MINRNFPFPDQTGMGVSQFKQTIDAAFFQNAASWTLRHCILVSRARGQPILFRPGERAGRFRARLGQGGGLRRIAREQAVRQLRVDRRDVGGEFCDGFLRRIDPALEWLQFLAFLRGDPALIVPRKAIVGEPCQLLNSRVNGGGHMFCNRDASRRALRDDARLLYRAAEAPRG